MEISDFADLIDKSIDISRYPNQSSRYIARLSSAEIKEGGLLKGGYGTGQTADQALSNYALLISGKKIVFNAMNPKYRQEYVVPQLTHKGPQL